LAHTLLRLLEDDELREKMGRAGRERALAKFTWDMVAETMLSRYRSISGSAASIPIKAPLVPLMEYASANMAS
jgi:hypothetical protein